MTISDAAFKKLHHLILHEVGIDIGGRLSRNLGRKTVPLLQSWGVTSLDALVHRIEQAPQPERQEGIDALLEMLTVKETYFFRDPGQFNLLFHDLLPTLTKEARPRPLRIWSAACSTGPEAYSLAIMLEEQNLRGSILATDISGSAVEQAGQGWYSDRDVRRGLDRGHLERHFSPAHGGWQANPDLRDRITTARINLTSPELAQLRRWAPFDLVLLRNVLIYFSESDKQAVLEVIRRNMAPHGILLTGAGEEVGRYDARFVTERRGFPPNHKTIFRPGGEQAQEVDQQGKVQSKVQTG